MNTVRPWLMIGKYRESMDRNLLAQCEIGAMLHLAEDVSHPDMTCLYLPVEDGVPIPVDLLAQGVAFILAQRDQEKKVFVACGAGMSRSVSFAVAALKEAEKLDLLTALRIVKQHHPEALPNPKLWQSLCSYYNEPIPLSQMIHIINTA